MQDFKNSIPNQSTHLTFVLVIKMRFGFCMSTKNCQLPSLWFLHYGNVKELSWEITQESLKIKFFARKLNHGEGLKR